MALTETVCRNAKTKDKPFKLSDSGGLFLYVTPAGNKLWRLAYRFERKQKTISFGEYPRVSLKDARKKRDEAKDLLADRINPMDVRRQAAESAKKEIEHTFRNVANAWFENKKDAWTQGYAQRIWGRIEADLISKIGHLCISEIKPKEVLQTVRDIEARGAPVIAKRVLQVAGQIFRYAIANDMADRDPTQDLKGILKASPPAKHRAALKGNELPDFFRALRAYDGKRQTILGLKFALHTFVRTSELRFAKWDEFENLETDEALWRIPAERMKMRKEHLVPISGPVKRILEELKEISNRSSFVFPSETKKGVISENTLIYAMYRMGYHSRATVHGFRGTASTVLNENDYNADWIERQLAHYEGNSVRAAYNSAQYLKQRRMMMEWWSDHLVVQECGGKRMRVVNG